MRFHYFNIVLAVAMTLAVLPPAALAGADAVGGAFGKNVDRALTREKNVDTEAALQSWAVVAEDGTQLRAANPGRTAYSLGSARAEYALGRYDRALEIYDAVHVAGGGTPYAWAHVYQGLTSARLGDAEKAVAAWRRVPAAVGATYTVLQEQIAAVAASAGQAGQAAALEGAAERIEASIQSQMRWAGQPHRPTLGQLGGVQLGTTEFDAGVCAGSVSCLNAKDRLRRHPTEDWIN